MTEAQFLNIYLKYNELIDRFSCKLAEYKSKNPKADISEQVKIIDSLIFLRSKFHQQYHLSLILDGHNGKWVGERARLMDRILSLEKELITIKTNINL